MLAWLAYPSFFTTPFLPVGQFNPYLTVSGSLSANSRAQYWLFQEIEATQSEVKGAKQVLKSARLPAFLDPKLFRMGILMTGKAPNPLELIRMFRHAD